MKNTPKVNRKMPVQVPSKKKLLYLAIAFTLLMILYAQFVFGFFSKEFSLPNHTNSLGLSAGYTWQEAMQFLSLRSREQLLAYIDFISLWDNIFPVIYTLMYCAWIAVLFNKWRILMLIPILRMITDWTENYFEVSLVREYLEQGIVSSEQVALSSGATLFKWVLSLVLYFILFSGIVLFFRRKWKKTHID